MMEYWNAGFRLVDPAPRRECWVCKAEKDLFYKKCCIYFPPQNPFPGFYLRCQSDQTIRTILNAAHV